MEKWKKFKLGEICQVINGRAYKHNELLNSGKYLVLRVGNIFQGNNWYYSNLELNNDKYCYNGDLLYAWSCGFAPYIWKGDKTIYHYHIWKIVEDKIYVDRKFLYYNLVYGTKRFTSGTHGSVMQHLTKQDMENQIITLPSIPTQRKISAILSSLDDKIEVNRKINENLEQQAQALFKSWFVDFEPFQDGEFEESELGMIPKGWKIGCIGDYCKVRSGFAFKSSWWTNKGVKIIKIKNISESGLLNLNDCSYVDKSNTIKASEFKAKAGDLIIAMTGATIGKFCIIPNHMEDLYINQRVGKFFLGNSPLEKLPFVHGCLQTKNVFQNIINYGQGSAQPNISGKDIENIRIIFPDKTVINNYNLLLQPLYKKILYNIDENERLSSLRDTLLPKLMSGEIEVKE